MALTAKRIAALTEQGRYHDGDGLYLQVGPSGSHSWLLRYERNGRERAMGLGSVNAFTLDEARERARRARQLLTDGIDPIEARKAERIKQRTEEALQAARNVTFEKCTDQFYDFHVAKWKNRKHAAQFLSTLKRYVFPIVGRLPVGAIDTALVLKALEPIWHVKTETASRVRGRIEAVLDFASVRGYRTGENPAAWEGNLAHVLPSRSTFARVKHHPALPYTDVPHFLTQLREREGIAARALEFTILTAARSGEAIGAQWPEVDLKAKLWVVPAERMKARKEHRVPLSDRAIAILRSLPRVGNFVFPGPRLDAPIGNTAMSRLLKNTGFASITVHGFRSSFRDWAEECTGYSSHVVEMALAHAISGAVEKAYRRGDLLEQRRKLMSAWAAYC
jgi:integrase